MVVGRGPTGRSEEPVGGVATAHRVAAICAIATAHGMAAAHGISSARGIAAAHGAVAQTRCVRWDRRISQGRRPLLQRRAQRSHERRDPMGCVDRMGCGDPTGCCCRIGCGAPTCFGAPIGSGSRMGCGDPMGGGGMWRLLGLRRWHPPATSRSAGPFGRCMDRAGQTARACDSRGRDG